MLVRFRVIFGQHYANRLHLGSRPLDDHLLRPSPVDIDAVYDIAIFADLNCVDIVLWDDKVAFNADRGPNHVSNK